MSESPVEGVNVTPPVLLVPGDQGTKVAPQGRQITPAGESCAPGGALIPLEDPEPCAHVIEIGKGMVCVRGRHLHNPNGHVYISASGSHVLDKHGDVS